MIPEIPARISQALAMQVKIQSGIDVTPDSFVRASAPKAVGFTACTRFLATTDEYEIHVQRFGDGKCIVTTTKR